MGLHPEGGIDLARVDAVAALEGSAEALLRLEPAGVADRGDALPRAALDTGEDAHGTGEAAVPDVGGHASVRLEQGIEIGAGDPEPRRQLVRVEIVGGQVTIDELPNRDAEHRVRRVGRVAPFRRQHGVAEGDGRDGQAVPLPCIGRLDAGRKAAEVIPINCVSGVRSCRNTRP